MTEWTPDQLKEHYDGLFESERRRVDEAIKRLDQATQAAEHAAALALSSAEKLDEKHNELIRKGENERVEFARKDEVGQLRNDVGVLGKAQARIAGASILGSVFLAIIINLMLRLAGVGGQ